MFAKEFEEDIHVIDYAVKAFNLTDNLKLSVHSGSDKFSIYPEIQRILTKYDKGIHVKTAGTTWLGGDRTRGIRRRSVAAKSIYSQALARKDGVCTVC